MSTAANLELDIRKITGEIGDTKSGTVDYACFGCNLDNCGLTVIINDEIVRVIRYDKVIEDCNGNNIICYLLQVEKPANHSIEKISRVKLALHDKKPNEYGEGTLFTRFFS